MKPEDRKRLKQHIEMIVEHKIPSNVVFCPNCEKETECEFTAELYECKECGEDFAKYIVSRNCNVSDVSMTRDVSTDIKTPSSIENTNPDYYKQELARRDEKIEILEDALHRISNWCKAYPLEIADEPTEQEWKDAHVVMRGHGFDLSKFAVSAMRRVTTGVAKIADLEEDE